MKVIWSHASDEEPDLIYSELDQGQWEARKIDTFRDGRRGLADREKELGESILGLKPWPDLKRLGSEEEFEISDISSEEFEQIWRETLKMLCC